jgi:hypothetical protein
MAPFHEETEIPRPADKHVRSRLRNGGGRYDSGDGGNRPNHIKHKNSNNRLAASNDVISALS